MSGKGETDGMALGDSASLGDYEASVEATLKELQERRVVERMWEGDYTVWGPDPDEIADRLGWLHSPEETEKALPGVLGLVEAVRSEGYQHVLLLGMGGSSLAPEVFGSAIEGREGYPDLEVLDSTDPGAVLQYAESLDLSRTLFVVSTKSGGTVETFSFFKYFYNRVAEVVGVERAGEHFVAITDPGSGLQDTAEKYSFRTTFLNDPNIGGRYSALSHFGIVPAALGGVRVANLLGSGKDTARECGVEDGRSVENNPGAWLGAVMGEMARSHGRDKLTLLTSPSLSSFGSWVEQLVAESTGKEGKGILPVTEEPPGPPEVYGGDRLFVSMGLRGEEPDGEVGDLVSAGHPVVQVRLDDLYQLGGEMFRWEVATAVAGYILSINPFDQPNVESAKVLARKMVEEYRREGELPTPEPTLEQGEITVYSSEPASNVVEALDGFLAGGRPGDYVALQAFVEPSEATTEALQNLRTPLRDRLRLATTAGYGPRFLHSTGQLHKGDAGNGLFIQFTADHTQDAPIPDEAGADAASLTFGVLEEAQALGDRQALLDASRRVIRLHLGRDVVGGLKRLAARIS